MHMHDLIFSAKMQCRCLKHRAQNKSEILKQILVFPAPFPLNGLPIDSDLIHTYPLLSAPPAAGRSHPPHSPHQSVLPLLFGPVGQRIIGKTIMHTRGLLRMLCFVEIVALASWHTFLNGSSIAGVMEFGTVRAFGRELPDKIPQPVFHEDQAVDDLMAVGFPRLMLSHQFLNPDGIQIGIESGLGSSKVSLSFPSIDSRYHSSTTFTAKPRFSA